MQVTENPSVKITSEQDAEVLNDFMRFEEDDDVVENAAVQQEVPVKQEVVAEEKPEVQKTLFFDEKEDEKEIVPDVKQEPEQIAAETEQVDENAFNLDRFISKLGIDLDGEFTEDEIVERIKTSQKPVELSPQMQKLNEFLASGGDIRQEHNAIASEYDKLINLDDEALARQYTLNQTKGDEKRANTLFEKLKSTGHLEYQMELLRNNLEENKNKALDDFYSEFKPITPPANNSDPEVDLVKELQAFTNDLVTELTNTKSLLGLDLTNSMRNKLVNMIIPDPKTGQSELTNALYNPKSLAIMLTALSNAKEIAANKTAALERGKQTVIGKLEKTPQTRSGGGYINGSGQIQITTQTNSKKFVDDNLDQYDPFKNF